MIGQIILIWILLTSISYSIHALIFGGETFFEPRDFWIGWYWDNEKHILYHFMIPMFGWRSLTLDDIERRERLSRYFETIEEKLHDDK